MRYQIYEAKSVKYDAQQRVGMIKVLGNPHKYGVPGASFCPKGTLENRSDEAVLPKGCTASFI